MNLSLVMEVNGRRVSTTFCHDSKLVRARDFGSKKSDVEKISMSGRLLSKKIT